MIKGVNRQILEVANPESPYFDRVLFFVSAQGGAASEEELTKAAQKIAADAGRPPQTRRSKKAKWRGALYALLGVGAVGALALALHAMI